MRIEIPENPMSTGQQIDAPDIPAPETVVVTKWRVACDGDEAAALGHPRVWLAISPDTGFVDCGYCDKRFVIDPAVAGEGH